MPDGAATAVCGRCTRTRGSRRSRETRVGANRQQLGATDHSGRPLRCVAYLSPRARPEHALTAHACTVCADWLSGLGVTHVAVQAALVRPDSVRLVFTSVEHAVAARAKISGARRGSRVARATYDKSAHRLHYSTAERCSRQVGDATAEQRLNPVPEPVQTRHAPPQVPAYVPPPKKPLRGLAKPTLDDVVEPGLGVDLGFKLRSDTAAATAEALAAEGAAISGLGAEMRRCAL